MPFMLVLYTMTASMLWSGIPALRDILECSLDEVYCHPDSTRKSKDFNTFQFPFYSQS
jgi:hypothetical protein